MSTAGAIAAIDLGKTRCRLLVSDESGHVTRAGDGTPGLAAPDGVEAAAESILALLDPGPMPHSLGVGAAGAWTAPAAARELAETLAAATGAAVAVASDVVTAHIGALDGAPGVLLIAGTGAVALGVDSDGIRLVDGWGPDIGDFGSGSWLGREAIRAVQRAAVGLGPSTALEDAVAAHIAPASDPLSWTLAQHPLPRALATLAPLVLYCAEQGDAVALEIAFEAVRLLTASAVAASASAREVALHGGLTEHPWFRERLTDALSSADRRVAPAVGDALTGAQLLMTRRDLPHERFVHRAE
ncbi:N-acetylglucosamine kinase [Microbacterium sp. NPDC089987]|uniref:N-acetylglucosamine kinase n=1 Tax=Microbacterium sp. NPDC089987 TaxID=3364202 RepID=UPI0037F6C1B0